jgi:hypothetical protein
MRGRFDRKNRCIYWLNRYAFGSRNRLILKLLVPGGGIEPPRAEARRILSSTVGSDPLGLLYLIIQPLTSMAIPTVVI